MLRCRSARPDSFPDEGDHPGDSRTDRIEERASLAKPPSKATERRARRQTQVAAEEQAALDHWFTVSGSTTADLSAAIAQVAPGGSSYRPPEHSPEGRCSGEGASADRSRQQHPHRPRHAKRRHPTDQAHDRRGEAKTPRRSAVSLAIGRDRLTRPIIRPPRGVLLGGLRPIRSRPPPVAQRAAALALVFLRSADRAPRPRLSKAPASDLFPTIARSRRAGGGG
jgi:hypothetical protein